MKKKFYAIIILNLIFFSIIQLFIKSYKINEIIIYGFNLFINNIFPSLFPMFLASSLLISIKLPNYLGRKLEKLMNKLFNLNGQSSFILFLSIITGFPSSAYFILSLMNNNLLNQKEAQKILCFSFFSNPLFIINTIGVLYLNNKTIALFILISHYLSNFILGYILKEKTSIKKTIKIENESFTYNILNTSYIKVILESIQKAFEVLLQILGIILFFLILSTFFEPIFKNDIIKALFLSILEITSGLKEIANLPISIFLKGILSTATISFGGLCIHAQIMNILNEKKISYRPFLISRILHIFISIILFIIIYYLFG